MRKKAERANEETNMERETKIRLEGEAVRARKKKWR